MTGSDLIMLEASSKCNQKKWMVCRETVKSTLNIDIANSTGIEWDGINFLIVDATGSINAYRGFSTDLLYTINFSTQNLLHRFQRTQPGSFILWRNISKTW